MTSELLHNGNNISSQSNSFRTKNTVETIMVKTNKTGDMLRRSGDKQQTITNIITTTNSNSGNSSSNSSNTTKQLMHHRFTVDDILSPLNNIGK
uniref:Uncharacterized protein n=1 Tax=Loa loa TaxID=7209 RepID=A0A1I7VH72_LOALO